ncbi:MAG: hypothetical protein IGS39_22955 [Calothrix sp. C42_A2020_038]|nr:hypothetical protein [Calothrix sp. C42_A2020_038]
MTDFDLNLREDTTQQSNYPTEEDSSFTPDEQEAIRAYKDNLDRKLNKNRSVLKGLEMSFWGITSYSLARFLVLTSGMDGVPLAISAILIINQITNREAIEELINHKGEDNRNNVMGRFIKFGFSTVITLFLMWGAVGKFLEIAYQSGETYKNIQTTIDKFNKLPESEQNTITVLVGLLSIAGVYIVIDSRRR